MSVKVLSGCEQSQDHALPPSVISYRTVDFTIWQSRPHGAHQSCNGRNEFGCGKSHFQSHWRDCVHAVGVLPLKCSA